MSVCVFLRVRVCECRGVSDSVRVRVRTSACVRGCAAVFVRKCAVHVSVCVHVCARNCMRVCVRQYARMPVSVHACIHVRVRVCFAFNRQASSSIFAHVCAFVCVCVWKRTAMWALRWHGGDVRY